MIIAITALKGGVAKTTTAVHLAAYLQTLAPTLLIDADKNRSALVWSKEDKLPFYVASQAGSPALIKNFTHIIIDTQARPEPDELRDLAQGSDLVILPHRKSLALVGIAFSLTTFRSGGRRGSQ